MLANVLALVVGLGSVAIYLAAFFFPEVHRKNDFIWSGVGLFYALVLWVCAGRITGALLLGQTASVALLGWSVTQTLQLRRQLTPRHQQTELPSAQEVKMTVQEQVSKLSLPEKFSQLGKQVSGTFTSTKDQLQQKLSRSGNTQPQSTHPKTQGASTPSRTSPIHSTTTPTPPVSQSPSAVEFIDNPTPTDAVTAAVTEEEAEAKAVEMVQKEQEASVPEAIHPHPPAPELVDAALQDAQEKSEPASPPETHPTDSGTSHHPG